MNFNFTYFLVAMTKFHIEVSDQCLKQSMLEEFKKRKHVIIHD